MKKFIKLLAVFSLALVISFGFCACSAAYSGDGIKNKLQNAGYTVAENYDIKFDDDTKASELSGIQKIYLITKGTDADKEVAIIIVFDSIKSVDSGISDQRLCDIYDEAKFQCGSNKKGETTMGKYNNIVFAGPQACKLVAEIN